MKIIHGGVSKVLLSAVLITLSVVIHAEQKETTYERYDTGDDASITIRDEGSGLLRIKGLAVWSPVTGSPHLGEIGGTVKIKNGVAHYSLGKCKATLTFTKNELIVTDDKGDCGGMNVGFNGSYNEVKEKLNDYSIFTKKEIGVKHN
jgi:hypothetical protein